VLFLLGGGSDSPNAAGGWGVEWSPATCLVVESRIQTLASQTDRVIFRVNVTSPNGTLISPGLGATAVAGDFGWGGYTDDRGDNTLEKAENDTRDHPPGFNQSCYYSSSGFLVYPAPLNCKRCSQLVYFHFVEDEFVVFQEQYTIFMVAGAVVVALGATAILCGCCFAILKYRARYRQD